jgi:phycocyanin beta chain
MLHLLWWESSELLAPELCATPLYWLLKRTPISILGELNFMLDAFAKVVSQADTRGDFLSDSQIDALQAVVSDGNKRMDVVNTLTSNSSTIVSNAARALFDSQPALIAPGGNAYTNRRMAACLRDLEIILRYITYAAFAGDASILEDRCLNGLKETYQALGVPSSSMSAAVKNMKDEAIALVSDPSAFTQGDCSNLIAEVGSYFDLAARAV